MDNTQKRRVSFWDVTLPTCHEFTNEGTLRFASKDELKDKVKFSRRIETIFNINNIVVVTQDQIKNLVKVFKMLSEWSRSTPSRSFSNSKLVDNEDQLE